MSLGLVAKNHQFLNQKLAGCSEKQQKSFEKNYNSKYVKEKSRLKTHYYLLIFVNSTLICFLQFAWVQSHCFTSYAYCDLASCYVKGKMNKNDSNVSREEEIMPELWSCSIEQQVWIAVWTLTFIINYSMQKTDLAHYYNAIIALRHSRYKTRTIFFVCTG